MIFADHITPKTVNLKDKEETMNHLNTQTIRGLAREALLEDPYTRNFAEQLNVDDIQFEKSVGIPADKTEPNTIRYDIVFDQSDAPSVAVFQKGALVYTIVHSHDDGSRDAHQESFGETMSRVSVEDREKRQDNAAFKLSEEILQDMQKEHEEARKNEGEFNNDILTERKSVYGDPVEMHKRIAGIWSSILKHDVSAHDVALCMVGLKLARAQQTPSHTDSLIDVAGYTEIAQLIAEREEM